MRWLDGITDSMDVREPMGTLSQKVLEPLHLAFSQRQVLLVSSGPENSLRMICSVPQIKERTWLSRQWTQHRGHWQSCLTCPVTYDGWEMERTSPRAQVHHTTIPTHAFTRRGRRQVCKVTKIPTKMRTWQDGFKGQKKTSNTGKGHVKVTS